MVGWSLDVFYLNKHLLMIYVSDRNMFLNRELCKLL